MDGKNYYEILEIPISAGPEEIHQGYIRSKNAYSGNSMALYSLMTQDECNKILEMVEEAYSILSDPRKRSEYDRIRGFNYHSQAPRAKEVGMTDFTIQPNQGHYEEKNKDIENLSEKLKHGQAPESFNIRRKEAEVSKIAAKKRFSLNYEINHDFEEEIDNCSTYTGEFLKSIREYKNVTVERLAEMTKISKTYITNIESEQLDNLPALVYVRGFVYQYAKMLKLNPDHVASSYIHHIKTKQQG